MSKTKASFSQQVTLMILFILLIGLGVWFIKLKKIDPQLRDLRDNVEEATEERDFAKNKKQEDKVDPEEFEKNAKKVADEKKRLTAELKKIKSGPLGKTDPNKAPGTLLEIITITQKLKMKVLSQGSLPNTKNKNSFRLKVLCHFKALPIFVDQVSKFSIPVVFDSIQVNNKGNHLEVALEFSL